MAGHSIRFAASLLCLGLALGDPAPSFAQDAAASYAELGKQAMAGGDAARAFKLFLRAHKEAPGNRDYLHNAAALAAATGNADQAAELYKTALGLAAKAGATQDVALYAAEIEKLRAALPAWAAEKQQAASAIAADKQSLVAIWDRLHNGALAAAQAGNAEKALSAGQRALTVARDNFGANHLATIVSQIDLGQVQAQAGQQSEAETTYRAAFQAAKETLGDGHPETLKVMGLLADLLTARADYAGAAALHEAMAAAAAQALGPLHAATLAARTGQANDLANAGKYLEADARLTGACADTETSFGALHGRTASCIMQHAAVARRLGEVALAGERADAALAAVASGAVPAAQAFTIRTQAAGIRSAQGRDGDAKDMLDSVIADAEAAGDAAAVRAAQAEMIDVLDRLGSYGPAENIARALLEWQSRTLGTEHPATVATMNSIAALQRKQGHLAQAEASFREVFERYGRLLGPAHPSTLVAANNLGEILEKQGLYDQAEPLLREAVAASRKALGETNPNTLISLNNLALLYESQGNFDKAESLYTGIIDAFSRSIGPEHPDTAAVMDNLAYLHMLRQDYAKAAPMFERVADLWTKTYGPDHQDTLKARNNQARVLHLSGMLPEAEALFRDTLERRRAALGERHLDVLRSQHDLGALLRTAKRLDEAEDLLQRTLATAEDVLGKHHPYTFETLNTLAAVKADKGDRDGALELKRETFLRRNDFLNRMLPVTGDNAREGYIRLHQPELASYADMLTGADPATAGRGLLEISLNRKGMLFKVAAEMVQISRLARDPKLTALTQELDQARKRLAALTLSGPTDETKDRHVAIMTELNERIERLQGELGRASAKFRKTTEHIPVKALVDGLPNDSVLVDFYQFDRNGTPTLVAATLRKDKGKPVFGLVEYGDVKPIEQLVLKYRADIQSEEIDFDDMLDTGASVYEALWRPLEKAIGDREKVHVVPDGVLNMLPFAALVDDHGKYLIESVDLHIYTSSRNLVATNPPAAKGGTMINAGPDYNTDEVTGKATLEKARRSVSQVQESMRALASGMRGLHFDPLPGAEKEGRLIMDEVSAKRGKATIYSKKDAQEQVLREMAQPPEILHIATHGFFLKPEDSLRKRLLKLQRGTDKLSLPPPGDNPLLRSGLAFAGINANARVLGEIDTDNDGILTALEVLGLNLTGTKLAILSACETGLGEIHEGEGVYGLRRAFQEAGVHSVISSLWEVSDAGTQKLMTALYDRLMAGEKPHQALRAAQLEMLSNGRWSSPFIWSAFFMVDG